MPMDLTAMLKEWGVTLGLLSVAATGLSVILVIALREFAHWFLGINQILKNQAEILKRLEHLEGFTAGQEVPMPVAGIPPAKSVVPEFEISPVDLVKPAETDKFRIQN